MTPLRRIRVLLADDHTLVRQGLRALLEREADIRVIGEAVNGRQALHQAMALRPDVVVMDLSMPRLNGLEATERIIAGAPGVRVVVLTMHVGEADVQSLLRAGASGYVPKDAPAAELIAAVRAVRAGGCYLHPQVSSRVVAGYLEQSDGKSPRQPRPPGPPGRDPLTPREREILRLIAEGMTNRAIAAGLRLSVKTVEAHRGRIMAKLQVHNTAGLTRYAMKRGIVSPE